jgi:hypothetical protein
LSGKIGGAKSESVLWSCYSRHYLAFPSTRSNPALLPPEVDPVVYKPKPRNALVTTFCRKLKALLLRRVSD